MIQHTTKRLWNSSYEDIHLKDSVNETEMENREIIKEEEKQFNELLDVQIKEKAEL